MKQIPEQVIQQQAFSWFNNSYCLRHHNPSLIIHSVPNGIPIPLPDKERARALDLLHKTGMINGVSDLMIHGLNGRCIWAECKIETGTQSESQILLEKKVTALGGIYFIFRSLEDFQKKINIHLPFLFGK